MFRTAALALAAAPLLLSLPALALAADVPSNDQLKFEPLIVDGKLDAFTQYGDAKYEVVDNAIVGTNGPANKHSFLATKKTFADFVFEVDVKSEAGGNSGMQIRSHVKDNQRVFGYQCEIDSSARGWSAGIYDEGRRGWLNDLKDNPAAQKAFKLNEWNRFRVVCIGPHIRTWVNDIPCADLLDPMDAEGFIAFQVHGGKAPVKVSWRNPRVADLGKHAWKPIWDGKSMEGLREIGKGQWKIEDGCIVGRQQAGEKEFGHLVFKDEMGDFCVRLKYKAVKGNSGLYFRVEEKGFSGISGFQAEIDAEKDAGGLYETNGRGWVVQPKPEAVKKYFKPQQWNEMTVIAMGPRVVVHVNGSKSAELKNDPSRLKGLLALQVHGSQDVEVHVKDIELLAPAK